MTVIFGVRNAIFLRGKQKRILKAVSVSDSIDTAASDQVHQGITEIEIEKDDQCDENFREERALRAARLSIATRRA